jgi:hypothetical protein
MWGMPLEDLVEGPGSQPWKEIEQVMWEMPSEDLEEGPGSQPWKEIEDLNTLDARLVMIIMGK